MKFETVETTQQDIDDWRSNPSLAHACPVERALERKGHDVGFIVPEQIMVDNNKFKTSDRVRRWINTVDDLNQPVKPEKFRIRVA